jgi:hypothetical protein
MVVGCPKLLKRRAADQNDPGEVGLQGDLDPSAGLVRTREVWEERWRYVHRRVVPVAQ